MRGSEAALWRAAIADPRGLVAAAPRWVGVVAPILAVTTCAAVFTYLYDGYRYGVWPQPGLLESVYALHGELQNDWFTSLPPVHWTLAHALALLPLSALRGALFVLWLIGILVLWGSVAALCRLLGGGAPAAVAAVVLILPTSLAGVGQSVALLGLMYPTTLAFAIGVAGLAALAGQRPLLAGLLVGLATAVHPNVGALFLLVLAPGVLVLADRVRSVLRAGIGFVVIGGFPLVHLALDKALSSSLPQREAYDLTVIVRNPHHALYRVFPATEYIHTVGWMVVFTLAMPLVARGASRRVVAVATCATAILAVLGGVASERRHPFLLVELLTSRMTPLIVLLGIITGVAALVRTFGSWGVVIAAVAFEIARVETPSHSFDASAAEAVVISLALTAAYVSNRYRRRSSARSLNAAGILLAAVGLFFVASDIVDARGWVMGYSSEDVAWREVAAETHARTPKGAIVLTPPDLDGFRFYARRAIVVDFGEFPFGRGTDEWSRRLVAVTGDPAIVTARLPPDAVLRSQRMGVDYDHETARTPRAACEYGARYVVTRANLALPTFLTVLFKNDYFVLSRLRHGACDEKRQSA